MVVVDISPNSGFKYMPGNNTAFYNFMIFRIIMFKKTPTILSVFCVLKLIYIANYYDDIAQQTKTKIEGRSETVKMLFVWENA